MLREINSHRTIFNNEIKDKIKRPKRMRLELFLKTKTKRTQLELRVLLFVALWVKLYQALHSLWFSSILIFQLYVFLPVFLVCTHFSLSFLLSIKIWFIKMWTNYLNIFWKVCKYFFKSCEQSLKNVWIFFKLHEHFVNVWDFFNSTNTF